MKTGGRLLKHARHDLPMLAEGHSTRTQFGASCHRFRLNEVLLWLSVIAYNLGSLWRRLLLPQGVENWPLTS